MAKRSKWTKKVDDPIEDMAKWLRRQRAIAFKRKCFKVNFCTSKEHEAVCMGCVFYRKKKG